MVLNNINEFTKAVLIAGPTASGKSSLALKLAARFNGVIVNADALQVYDCWRVLTARPDEADQAKASHALYGHIGKTSRYSVGAWLKDVARVKSDYSGRPLIITGGTGLYFTALTNGLSDIPNVPTEIRTKAQSRVDAGEIDALLNDLRAHDPETLGRIDVRNPVRVQRAWEVWRATGVGLAVWHKKKAPPLIPLGASVPIVITAQKEDLNPRISMRFQMMVSEGALDECRAALADWTPSLPSSRAIGAHELIAYLNGQTDLESAISMAEIATHQYAKRQRSWFRSNMKTWNHLDLHEINDKI